MEKINFQNATLKSQAHVIINGQTYNVVDSEYTGGTNLDANTLNYAFQLMHPVGSIYMTTVETNPKDIFGFGTWELWGKGKVPVGVDTTQTEFNKVEKIGGEKTHTLTSQEMPSHQHPINVKQEAGNPMAGSEMAVAGGNGEWGTNSLNTQTFGGNQPHNNLQPYITCYMFKRTA